LIRETEVLVSIQEGILLLLEWKPRRQWHKMPVNVTVALLTPKAEDVKAFGRDGTSKRLTYPINDPLDRHVFIF